jgi:hypothetical protein
MKVNADYLGVMMLAIKANVSQGGFISFHLRERQTKKPFKSSQIDK